MARAEHQDNVVPPGDGEAVSLGGLSAAVRLDGARTAGAYAVVEHVLRLGALGAPPHSHAHEDEVSLVLEGELGVMVGAEVFAAAPGAYVVKPRGVPHTFWNGGTAPVRFVEIVSPPGFERYFAEAAALLARPGPPDPARLGQIAASYGLTMHLEQLPDLMRRFGVSLGP